MMTNEEKDAIFRIRELEDNKEYLVIEQRQAVTTVLSLIDKQQKEIEELKELNRKLKQCHFRYEEMTGIDLLLGD